MPERIQQGHRYSMGQHDVIAMESGHAAIRVSVIDHDLLYPLRAPQWTHASQLKPMPMRYLGGHLPNE